MSDEMKSEPVGVEGHVKALRELRDTGDVSDWRLLDAALDIAIAVLAPQPHAEAHCETCSCVPGMTPAIRFDTTPAERDGVVRDHLIRMGWTPPAEAQAEGGDLLPCPMCGESAAVNTCRTNDREFIRLNKRDTGYGVNCIACGLNNRGVAYGYATAGEAIAGWNRRTPPPSATVRYFTEEVGKDGNPTGYLLFGQREPVGVADLIERLEKHAAAWPSVYASDRQNVALLRQAAATLAQKPAAVDGAMVEVASLPALWMREADEIDRLGYVVNTNSIRARASELERALAAQHGGSR